MPIKKALNHFLGKDGCPRFNCAQSVLAAFGVDEETIGKFAHHGSGRAPEGWCGAAAAAAFLINNKALIEKCFIENAGAVTCQEIRSLKKLSCVKCVELATDFVQKK